MTLITDMGLPDEAVQAGRKAMMEAVVESDLHRAADSCIRAFLQAMVDGGMARIVDEEHSVLNNKWTTCSLRIRLTADERKPKEQT